MGRRVGLIEDNRPKKEIIEIKKEEIKEETKKEAKKTK